uniref:SAM domain-containing protein n=1 Tax=Tetraodon nigroviridis TaxID=99883 RepID=H3CFJ3_TETNG
RRSWSWQQYLNEQKAEAAPVSLFTQSQSFPSRKTGFKVGMKLEGIDPLHPSMFCVLTVAEVIGCRLRLHIDGFSECYDFWVNSDSAEIRPAGWCKDNKRKLHPPKAGQNQSDFDWTAYLDSCGSRAAPSSLFTSHRASQSCDFQVGMKLEAVDKKNPGLVCVASVTDVVDGRFLVHFDNWDDTYDYWCDSSSPYIHPVGWCEEQGRPLTSPQGHPNPENFLWEEYLQETGSVAAPSSAFQPRRLHRFQVHHKLEAVDRRNPLIRVATVTETDDCRVKVHYDGWSQQFDVWCDGDNSDLHPVGWCQRTEHPLEPPPGSSPVSSPSQGVCPTPGCRGVGHIKGARYTGHHRQSFGCPYSDINTRKEVVLPDRLGGERVITLVPVSVCSHGNQPDRYLSSGLGSEPDWRRLGGGFGVETRSCSRRVVDPAGVVLHPHLPVSRRDRTGVQVKSEDRREPLEEKSGGQVRRPSARAGPAQPLPVVSDAVSSSRQPLTVAAQQVPPRERGRGGAAGHGRQSRYSGWEQQLSPTESSLQAALHQSIFLSAMSAQPGRDLSLCWEQHRKLLPGVVRETAETVQHWSVQQVADFVESLPGCEEQSKQFRDEQIDGRAFLLLTQRDIVRIMSIKLGPALKIYNSILMFKHAKSRSQSPA